MLLFIEHFLHCFTEHHRACGELINEYVVRKTSRTMSMIGDNKCDQLMQFWLKMAPKREQTKTHRIGESGYILPDHIPPGEIVHGLKNGEDMIQKNTWRIGRSIGKK